MIKWTILHNWKLGLQYWKIKVLIIFRKIIKKFYKLKIRLNMKTQKRFLNKIVKVKFVYLLFTYFTELTTQNVRF